MTMRDRIARAIDPERWAAIESGTPGPEACQALYTAEMLRVLAVLAVMRVPSEAMIEAYADASWSFSDETDNRATEAWQAMIDAIASEVS